MWFKWVLVGFFVISMWNTAAYARKSQDRSYIIYEVIYLLFLLGILFYF